jgi:hypothetical protein
LGIIGADRRLPPAAAKLDLPVFDAQARTAEILEQLASAGHDQHLCFSGGMNNNVEHACHALWVRIDTSLSVAGLWGLWLLD